MYSKIAVLNFIKDEMNGGAKEVTLAFFDEQGVLQLQVPKVNGKLFGKDIKKGQAVVFCNQNLISLVREGGDKI